MATLTYAYKAVQRIDGRMWSVNAYPWHINHYINDAYRLGQHRACEYKLNVATFPAVNDISPMPFIFITPDLTEAVKARKSYLPVRDDIVILKGAVQNMVIGNRVKIPSGGTFKTPDGFKSAVCDWFLPLEIVKLEPEHIPVI